MGWKKKNELIWESLLKFRTSWKKSTDQAAKRPKLAKTKMTKKQMNCGDTSLRKFKNSKKKAS